MLCFKVYWQLTIGEDTPETSLVLRVYFMEKNTMKFKTVVLCFKVICYKSMNSEKLVDWHLMMISNYLRYYELTFVIGIDLGCWKYK